MLSKEHAAVLAGIQAELIANEADRKRSIQACPVYYGIIDRDKYVTAEGHHDFVEYFDTDRCCTLDDDEVLQRIDEYMDLQDDDDRSYAADHWHEDCYEIEPIYMASRAFIVPNCMFLTRAEADAHLAAYRYHYTDWAHSYAMTAWRSPMVEQLLRVLQEADFSCEGESE